MAKQSDQRRAEGKNNQSYSLKMIQKILQTKL